MLPNAVNLAVDLIKERRFAELGRKCIELAYIKTTAYGLRRDLHVPITRPQAKIAITVRPFQESDVPILLPADTSDLARKERIEIRTRRAHYEAKIPTCYVAVDGRNGTPCYFQWLMGSPQNNRIQSHFPKIWFPVLGPDEALLENAYTPPNYRGQGIMSAAMALIAEHAADLGCRYVHTFVLADNVASLRGCNKAGFFPYIQRREQRVLRFSVNRRFLPLSPNA